MIFAAGLGKRLKGITETTPKALVDINGKSALRRAAEYCTAGGFDDIIINVHHFAGQVEEEVHRLRSMGLKITISDERDKLLENGGGLWKAREFFDDNPFLLYNVDIVTDLRIKELFEFYSSKKGIAVVAVRQRPGKRFLLTDNSGLLCGWCNDETGEKILTRETASALIKIANSSVHIVNPEIFNYMEEGVYSMVELYLRLMADHQIWTYRHDDGFWFDIGTPENLEEVRKYLTRISGSSH